MTKINKLLTAVLACAMMIFVTACGESSASAKKYSHGKLNGNVYSSEFIGITAEFGSDWTFLDDKALLQSNGITEFSEENAKSGNYITEMWVSNSNNDSVNITVQNIKAVGLNLTEEKLIEKTIETVDAQYSAYGLESKATKGTGTFAGKTVKTIHYDVSSDLMTIEQMQYLIFEGNYAIAITVTITSDSNYTIDEVASWFKAA